MADNPYQSGKIYKIVDNGCNLCYYGSTTQPLSKRMSSHRNNYQMYIHGNKQKFTKAFTIFDEYGVGNCEIELVEAYPCSSKEELHRKEAEYIKSNTCVNKTIPGRSRSEYYVDCADILSLRQKEQYQKHKEKRLAKVKEYYEKVKATEMFKDKKKEYAETHKERLQEYRKEYGARNAQQIAAKRNIEITCDVCGHCFSLRNKARHLKSDRHQRASQQQDEFSIS